MLSTLFVRRGVGHLRALPRVAHAVAPYRGVHEAVQRCGCRRCTSRVAKAFALRRAVPRVSVASVSSGLASASWLSFSQAMMWAKSGMRVTAHRSSWQRRWRRRGVVSRVMEAAPTGSFASSVAKRSLSPRSRNLRTSVCSTRNSRGSSMASSLPTQTLPCAPGQTLMWYRKSRSSSINDNSPNGSGSCDGCDSLSLKVSSSTCSSVISTHLMAAIRSRSASMPCDGGPLSGPALARAAATEASGKSADPEKCNRSFHSPSGSSPPAKASLRGTTECGVMKRASFITSGDGSNSAAMSPAPGGFRAPHCSTKISQSRSRPCNAHCIYSSSFIESAGPVPT